MQDLLNILFPKSCIFCQKKGFYVCEDCFSLIDINPFQFCICGKIKGKLKCRDCFSFLDGLFVCSRQNQIIVDKIINNYSKIKELSLVLSLIIITHLFLLKENEFSNFAIYPLLSNKKELKRTGFDKTKEIGKILSQKLKIPLIEEAKNTKRMNVLILDISYNEKIENISKQLKENGVNKVLGLVIKKH